MICTAVEGHTGRQWTEGTSHVMCVPLYARLVRPVEVLQFGFPDWHPTVCKVRLDAKIEAPTGRSYRCRGRTAVRPQSEAAHTVPRRCLS